MVSIPNMALDAMHILIRLLFIGLGLSAFTQAAAMTCALFSSGKEPAQVEYQGSRMQTPLRLDACEHAKIIDGDVEVCYKLANGQNTCRKMTKADEIDPRELSASFRPDNSFLHVFKVLKAVAQGDFASHIGVTRGNETPPGFPYGKLMPREDALEIEIDSAAIEKPDSFSLIGKDGREKTIPVERIAPNKVRIDAAALKPGHTYIWRAESNPIAFQSEFRIASTNEAARVAREIDVIENNASISAYGKSILIAEAYDSNGFQFDRDRILVVCLLNIGTNKIDGFFCRARREEAS